MLKELYKALEKPITSPYGDAVEKIILITILINLSVSLGRSIFNISDTLHIFSIIEYATVAFFIVELLARYLTIGHDERYRGIKGRVAFTFTPFILIDIIAIAPYFIGLSGTNLFLVRVIRFIRFLKIFKLMRVSGILKKFFRLSSFAVAPLWVQISVLFIFSTLFILLFSFVYADARTSLMIFLDPPALAEATSTRAMFFGTIELMIGLLVGGALISILTELFAKTTNDIKSGYHNYKEKKHIIIIHNNLKLEFILKEINNYYKNMEEKQEVVLFLPNITDMEAFEQNFHNYTNLNVTPLTGDTFSWNSYARVNINHAQKILILSEENTPNDNFTNVKLSRYILAHKHFRNPSLEFVIDAQGEKTMEHVYAQIFSDKTNQYSLIWQSRVIQSFLNRSVIEYDYFKIYFSLLSFEGHEFYRLKAQELFEESLNFREAYLQFSEGILVGIRKKEGKLLLNPQRDTVITPEDKLVTILENKLKYTSTTSIAPNMKIVMLKPPSLTISRSICIVGDYNDIGEKHIAEFLSQESRDTLTHRVAKSGNYMNTELWDKIVTQAYDVVLLNMEDDYEFILTMYLRNIYASETKFIHSIINVMHNPLNAKLLEEKHSNVILSDKLVGQYAVQVMFNHGIIDIFDEITHAHGNEFHILEKVRYPQLYRLEYKTLKITLLENNMIYIGIIMNDEFIVDSKDVSGAKSVVVLASGNVQ